MYEPIEKMYRLDAANADLNNPYYPRQTQRPPGNVPYIVDNLWEWRRPDRMPSRRHCVCASPKIALAKQAGGASGGKVFEVDINDPNARIAQIPQWDARIHPEAAGSTSLAKFILRKLGQQWLDAPAKDKSTESLLWTPCLSREEVEEVFNQSERLKQIRDEMCRSIQFWDDAKLHVLGDPWPYSEGEIFFEASEWSLRAI